MNHQCFTAAASPLVPGAAFMLRTGSNEYLLLPATTLFGATVMILVFLALLRRRLSSFSSSSALAPACQIVGRWWSWNLRLFMLFLMSGLPLCDEPPFASEGNSLEEPL